jgi:hypothetical protein
MGIIASLKRLFAAPALTGPPNAPGVGCVVAGTQRTPAVPVAPPTQQAAYHTPFVRSFEPFKAEKIMISDWAEKKQQEEWEAFGRVLTKDNYPHGYGIDRDADGLMTGRYKEMFRSKAEVGWAKTFDDLGLPWQYEPLKFDMGPEHYSYTPDFRVSGLSVADSEAICTSKSSYLLMT